MPVLLTGDTRLQECVAAASLITPASVKISFPGSSLPNTPSRLDEIFLFFDDPAQQGPKLGETGNRIDGGIIR